MEMSSTCYLFLSPQLEDELVQQPPTKHARTSIASTPVAARPSLASIKMNEKKRKMQAKEVFDRRNANSTPLQGSLPSPISRRVLLQLFISQNFRAYIGSFFGDEFKPVKDNSWSRGGMPQRTFGAGFGGFCSNVYQFPEDRRCQCCHPEVRGCLTGWGGHSSYDAVIQIIEGCLAFVSFFLMKTSLST
ncbi:hypothetical protein BYT27DRAFT_6788299 [Phlegmacium glaucopus]|nr:hypothetical protein BYT27DRAFT_6788299 [Phlegmacium glaucopus]